MSPVAFVREVSPRLGACELTHLARSPIDPALARIQHEGYAAALRELGTDVRYLPALPESPDGVFVEDTAVLLPEVAVIGRPGAVSRQAEVCSVAPVLEAIRPLARMDGPASLEGGDVLRIGQTLFVGASTRTNAAGVAALRQVVEPLGYVVEGVQMNGCLHLKTACTFVPPHFVIANAAWVDVRAFRECALIPVDTDEAFAANTLTVGGTVLISASYPRTARRLREAGIATRALDVSELHKAEAGLTCLSIIA